MPVAAKQLYASNRQAIVFRRSMRCIAECALRLPTKGLDQTILKVGAQILQGIFGRKEKKRYFCSVLFTKSNEFVPWCNG